MVNVSGQARAIGRVVGSVVSADARARKQSLEEINERWRVQVARVAEQGDRLAQELATLREVWREAHEAFPGPPADPTPRAAGLELPPLLTNLFLGGSDFEGRVEVWKAECRRRGWLPPAPVGRPPGE